MYLCQLSLRSLSCSGRSAATFVVGLLVLVLSACSTTPSIAPARDIKIMAVGDIMLGASATPEIQARGYDYPFDATRALFAEADIVIGNLEGPLTVRGVAEGDKKYVFRSPPDKVAPALRKAGFTVVSLANNHTLDYGVDGLHDTLLALDQAGIKYFGAGMDGAAARAAVIQQVADTKIAFLGYSLTYPENFWAEKNKPGTAFGHAKHIETDVAKAKQEADLVVVSFHWGRESTTELRYYQPQLARVAIDAGATLVLGHHPHILQGVERYQEGLIFYSLGNFAFGSYSQRARRSAIAEITIRDKRLAQARLLPLNVYNPEVIFQPQLLSGSEAHAVIRSMQTLSQALGTIIENQDGIGIISLSDPLHAEIDH